jgi:glycosyltransferase involved in cell wall biosynthesis
MDKKNILIISHGAALGGSPISALNIGRFINKQEFNPIFVFGEDGPIVEVAKSEGFKVYVIKKRGFLALPFLYDFIKLIKKESIDLVHLNTLTSYYKYPAIASKLLNKKTVWFVRENPEEKRCVKLSKYINNYSQKIVTVSYDTAKHMYYANKDKLMTIHNGINLDFYNNIDKEVSYKVLKLDSNFKYLTTIASLEPRKGILELIDSFNLIHNEIDSNLKLLIVGKDRTKTQSYLEAIKKRIIEYNLEDKIIIFGESNKIKEIMAVSEVFILNAYWEGLSRVLLEAMICGKPILASFNGGNKEQVIDDFNGYTFNAGDVQKLSELIVKIVDSDLKLLGNHSKQLVSEKFDIIQTTIKIEKLYKSLL